MECVQLEKLCGQADESRKTNLLTVLGGRIKCWNRRYSSRRQLLQMDLQQLNDLGISRADALAEAKRPFWK